MKNKILGKLYLIPTTLGEMNPIDVLPSLVLETINRLEYFVVENEKTARKSIKACAPEKAQQSLKIKTLEKHSQTINLKEYLQPCFDGIDLGLISEAGCPAVADPGANMVTFAHENNIEVIPMVGPSSILLSLMGSGLNGQNFAFNGYLPIDKELRKKELKQLEKLSFQKNQTQLFIETPYRNNSLFEHMLQVLGASTKLCVACNLTLESQYIKTYSIKQWKGKKIDLHKKPTIFLIQK